MPAVQVWNRRLISPNYSLAFYEWTAAYIHIYIIYLTSYRPTNVLLLTTLSMLQNFITYRTEGVTLLEEHETVSTFPIFRAP
jgi:hypothetical protein